LQDHQRIQSLVLQLEGDSGLGKLLFDVGDLLERHIRKEERELFPLFERYIGAQEAGRAAAEINRILGRQPSDA
jgi:hemerythrin-like domain-containing protein